MNSDMMTRTTPLKRQAQALLKRAGLYQRLKSSRLYDFYWSFANPQWLTDRAKELGFYRTTLAGFQTGGIIFDIGANDGYKTDIFLRLGANVVAVEPDPTNQQVLKQKFLKNRLVRRPVTIEGKAVSDRVAMMTMWIDTPGSAMNTLNSKWVDTLRNSEIHSGKRLDFAGEIQVETTTLDALVTRHGTPFFIKIDVEGHEPEVLRGLKCPVPYLSFEVILPEFKAEGLECIHLLDQITARGEFNYVVDCRRGLALKQWMPAEEFVRAFEACKDYAIEVFWRTPERFPMQTRADVGRMTGFAPTKP